ncbi:MAG: calcium/sodium antiporter [Methanobrevibacter sp.]|nr:calcium/sodium antiporter [Candidatus Methanovirga meridionalis]
MLDVIINIIILIVSLIVVIKAADVFIENISLIGTALGVSQIVLGVTAAAIGTSLPEFGSALLAIINHSSHMGVGIVIGSNIWNVVGIFGITATITGCVKADKKSLNRDGLVAIITGVILIGVMILSAKFTNPLDLSKGEIGIISSNIPIIFGSLIMVFFYLYYFKVLIRDQKKSLDNFKKKSDKIIDNKQEIILSSSCNENNNINELEVKKEKLRSKNVILVILSISALAIACDFLIDSATELAHIMGIPETIMALFTLSIGTSIPELVVTLSSAMKGLYDLSLGTVFGSVTFNILIPIGLLSFYDPIHIETLSLYFDTPVMILSIVVAIVLFKLNNRELNRISGLFLIGLYIVYAYVRIFFLGGM